MLDRDGATWGWDERGIVRWKDGVTTWFEPTASGIASVVDAMSGDDRTLWFLGNASDGRNVVSVFDGTGWRVVGGDFLQGGLAHEIVTDGDRGAWIGLLNPPRGPHRVVRLLEGRHEIVDVPPDASLHEYWIHSDASGHLWVFGEFGALERTGETWARLEELPGGCVRAMYDDGEDLWAGYTGISGGRAGLSRRRDGVWQHFDVPLSSIAYNTRDGVSFAGSAGLLRAPVPSDGTPIPLSTPAEQSVRAVVDGRDGALWVQTCESIFHYQPDRIVPETRVHPASDVVRVDEPLLVRFDGVERFKPRGTGAFTFSWRFDGGPWSEFAPAPTAANGLAHALAPGSHVLEVRARDEGLDVDPTPVRLAFNVRSAPLQERASFWVAVAVTFALTVFLSVVALVSRHRLRGHADGLEARCGRGRRPSATASVGSAASSSMRRTGSSS